MHISAGSMNNAKPQGWFCKHVLSKFGHKHGVEDHGKVKGQSKLPNTFSSNHLGGTSTRQETYFSGNPKNTYSVSGCKDIPQGALKGSVSTDVSPKQATDSYNRRNSAPTPNSFSAGRSLDFAQRWFENSKNATSDTARLEAFNNGVTYAEYAAVLGNKDAAPAIAQAYREGIKGLDGQQLVDSTQIAKNITFWNNVQKESKKEMTDFRLGTLGGRVPNQTNPEIAAIFIHKSEFVHGNHDREFSLEHVQTLVADLHKIQNKELKEVPSEISIAFNNRQRLNDI